MELIHKLSGARRRKGHGHCYILIHMIYARPRVTMGQNDWCCMVEVFFLKRSDGLGYTAQQQFLQICNSGVIGMSGEEAGVTPLTPFFSAFGDTGEA